MTGRRRLRAVPIAALLPFWAGFVGATGPAPGDSVAPAEVLVRYVEEHRRARGVVVARLDGDDVQVDAAGSPRAADGSARERLRMLTGGEVNPGPAEFSRETLFEIGSVTKVFTALLLVDMVERREVRLETTLGQILPNGADLDPAVATITLEELATHTSGLPRVPRTGPMLRRTILRFGDPYAGSTRAELFQAVAALDDEDVAGRGRFTYSNLGSAVLGRALEVAVGTPYEELLRERILDRFGMHDTDFTGAVAGSPAFARGHRDNLRSTRNWRLDAYAPAGGLASNVDDLIRFLEVALSGEDALVERSLTMGGGGLRSGLTGAGGGGAAATGARPTGARPAGVGPAGVGGGGVALGWIPHRMGGEPLFWHNGRTAGYYAWVGFLPESQRGLVVLSNTAHSGDGLARYLLGGSADPPGPERRRLWEGLTLLLTGLVPWMAYLRRRELAVSAERDPLLLGAAGRDAAGKARGRVHLLPAVGEAALVLSLTWMVGRWEWIPPVLWWIAFGAALVFLLWALRPAARLPWFPAGSFGRALLPLLSGGVMLGLAGWLYLAF